MASIDDFEKIDIRVGTIIQVDDFPEARIASYIFKVDFGPEIGQKKSCGRYPANYTKQELIGKQIAAVINFPPRQIGPLSSEILILGFPDETGQAVLITPTKEVPIGGRLF